MESMREKSIVWFKLESNLALLAGGLWSSSCSVLLDAGVLDGGFLVGVLGCLALGVLSGLDLAFLDLAFLGLDLDTLPFLQTFLGGKLR